MHSEKAPNYNSEVPLDLLTEIPNTLRKVISGIEKVFSTWVLFLFQHKIVTILVLVLSIFVGWKLDQKKKYEHFLVVHPNVNSSDYLYDKVAFLESKIKDRDTLFLKEIGIEKSKRLDDIQIKSIPDIYSFITDNEKNIEMVKLLSETSNIQDIVQDKLTSKNYKYHKITINSNSKIDEKEVIMPLLNFFNDSDYYNKAKKQYSANIKIQMAANEKTLGQIDDVFKSFSNPEIGSKKSNSLVFYNENTQLNDLLKTKEKLEDNLDILRLELLHLEEVIQKSSLVLNQVKTTFFSNKKVFFLPLLALIIYPLFFGIAKKIVKRTKVL